MNKRVGFLGISATLVRISAGIVGGVLAGYLIRDYLQRNRVGDKDTRIVSAVEILAPDKFRAGSKN